MTIGRLKEELAWLERNTVGVPGEQAAALESWSNVRRYLDELQTAATPIPRPVHSPRAALAAVGWEVWVQEGVLWACRRGEGVIVRLRERSGRLQVVDAVGDAATIAAWILGAAALAGSTPQGSSTQGPVAGDKDGGER